MPHVWECPSGNSQGIDIVVLQGDREHSLKGDAQKVHGKRGVVRYRDTVGCKLRETRDGLVEVRSRPKHLIRNARQIDNKGIERIADG